MAALPSFVQLMATLGLSDPIPESKPSHSRSRSSPSLREAVARQASPRYAPYSPPVSCHQRKGSQSSISSLSDIEMAPIDAVRRTARRHRHKISRSDSSCDLIMGDTPISIYVRRKTPGSSPITPNFDSGYESSASYQRPFSIPTLPSILLASSPTSESESPTFDCEGEVPKDQDHHRFVLQRTGTRISATPATRKRN